ncbi:hypothetical protein L3X38_008486 [Prunus dulcis]|uniref:Uncharacterized protein n=1 Tax=Prunus dulcis TaxID=3755 RepID=A0AAD5F6W5_PRUDU|nr:hypothetical protein L3X38_008486 [Prunus dulcis]
MDLFDARVAIEEEEAATVLIGAKMHGNCLKVEPTRGCHDFLICTSDFLLVTYQKKTKQKEKRKSKKEILVYVITNIDTASDVSA